MSNYNKIPLRIFNTKAELDAYYEDITPYEVGLYISDNKYIVGYFPEEGGDANPNPFSGENYTLPDYVPDSPIDPTPTPTPTGTLDKYMYFRSDYGDGYNVPFLYQGVAYLTAHGLTFEQPESGEYETITGPTTLYIEYNSNNERSVRLEFYVNVIYVKDQVEGAESGPITVTSDPANDEITISYSLKDGDLTNSETYNYTEYLDKFYGEEAGVTADDFNCNVPVLPIDLNGWFDWQTILEVDSIENEIIDPPEDFRFGIEFVYPFAVTDSESKVYNETLVDYIDFISDKFVENTMIENPIGVGLFGGVDSDNDLDTHDTAGLFDEIEYIQIVDQEFSEHYEISNIVHTLFAEKKALDVCSQRYTVQCVSGVQGKYFDVNLDYYPGGDIEIVIDINEIPEDGEEGEPITITLEYATLDEYMQTFNYTEPSSVMTTAGKMDFIPVNVFDIFDNIPQEYSFSYTPTNVYIGDAAIDSMYIHKDLLDEDSPYYENNENLTNEVGGCFANNRVYKETHGYTIPLFNDKLKFDVYFTPTTYTVSTEVDPTGAGTTKIEICKSDGNLDDKEYEEYVEGSILRVTATPASGYKFVNWTEDDVEVSPNTGYKFKITEDRTLVANFEVVTTADITLSADPVGSGSVSHTGSTDIGESYTAIATANTGYVFVNWTENGTEVSTSANYTFTVTGDRTLVANFEVNPYAEPFYVENINSADETLTITGMNANSPTLTIEYSSDKTNWSTLGTTSTTALTRTITPGEKLYLRSNTNTWCNNSGINNYGNKITGVSKVGGNAMSLIYGSNFNGQSEFPTGYTHQFHYLLYDNTKLKTAADLKLPATILYDGCYSQMFGSCGALTTPPALPATTLAADCYSSMFGSCGALTTPPALPATTLASGCYKYMFSGCKSLTSTPELLAPTLVYECYKEMFCNQWSTANNLNYIKCLATNLSGNNCLASWLNGVASTGTFVKAAGVNWPTGTSGIPEGWTVEEV